MSFPRYPAYTDSGVAWLGEVPAHWQVKRLKFVADFVSRGNAPDYVDDGRVKVVSQACIQDTGIDLSRVKYDAATDILAYKGKLQQDDVLLNSTGTGTLGRVGLFNANDDGLYIADGHVTIIRDSAHRFVASYLYYFLQPRQDWITTHLSDGATNQIELNREKLRTILVPFPPLAEQQAIAAFLDREAARIDALIAKQTALLALLAEKRQALISEAVTRGLDPSAPRKDSGIEWLGEVPAHWTVKRLKFSVSTPIQYGANESGEETDVNFPRFIRITDIDSGVLRDDTFRSLPYDLAAPYMLADGDMLFARSGATVGKSFLYRSQLGPACYAGYLIRARVNRAILHESFLYYFVNSGEYWNWINNISIQATIQNVSGEKYANLEVPHPPLAEQQAIAAYLDAETARLDALVAKATQAIALLREHRSALISAAVTGQIDVRRAPSAPSAPL